jgi:hypothetical protein
MMLKFWIICIVKDKPYGQETFVSGNKVFTYKAEAHQAWEDHQQESDEHIELWECTGRKCIAEK